MSANPHKPAFDLAEFANSRKASPGLSRYETQSGHEALQALLAFSSLHDQIRQRRSPRSEIGEQDIWELEDFVLDEVLHLVAQRALTITGADGTAIALAEGEAIICRAAVGTISPDPGARLSPNSGFSGACFGSGLIIRCDDSEIDTRVDAQACRRLGTRSMVAVPLIVHDNVIGLIEAFSSEAYAFNDSDVRSLSLLAELILAALKPEEEDRMAEISRRVIAKSEAEAQPEAEVDAPSPARIEPQPRHPAEELFEAGPASPQFAEPLAELTTPFSSPAESRNSRTTVVIVMMLVLLAAIIGGFVWWRLHQSPVKTHPAETASSVAPVAALGAAADLEPASAPVDATSGLSKVTGIRHWSSPESSTVVVDLEDQVVYEAHRLSEPDRIYFDLHDTALKPELSGRNIEVNDLFIGRIRVAQSAEGTTRVVIETKASSAFSVSLEQNPYRLVVEVHNPGAKPQPPTSTELFTPRMPKTAALPMASSRDRSMPNAAATKLRIVIDAGHGGWDLGTVGRRGLLEKDLALDVVARLGRLVENGLGAEVIYTRQDDTYVSLERRAEIANLAQADLFISVHANYSSLTSARGVETYYTNTYSSVHARTAEANERPDLTNIDWTNVDLRQKVNDSRKFADDVQRSLFRTLVARTPDIRNRGVKKASYVVLTGTTMPAILTEISFVSSPSDESALKNAEYRQRIAEALYKGVRGYTKDLQHPKLASASSKANGG